MAASYFLLCVLFWAFTYIHKKKIFHCYDAVHVSLFFAIFWFVVYLQRCPEATAHGDFASYSCPMRRLLFQNLMYSTFTSIANVVIFAVYSSQCAIYFEKCGQHCRLSIGMKFFFIYFEVLLWYYIAHGTLLPPVSAVKVIELDLCVCLSVCELDIQVARASSNS